MMSERIQWRRMALIGLIGALSGLMAGCGDDKGQATMSKPSSEKPSHTVSLSEHQAFEKKYVEMCVKAQPPSASDQEVGAMCQCMAQEISKRLSKADAVHFLEKGEFPFDLVMMTNSAENTCSTKAR